VLDDALRVLQDKRVRRGVVTVVQALADSPLSISACSAELN
jgi:hypothetical protein